MTAVRTERVVVESDGILRRSLFHLPERKNLGKLPLVLAFHGGGGKPEQMDRLTGFDALSDSEGFAVAYPEGINKHWNDGRELPIDGGRDDVGFVARLIDHLVPVADLDRERIYAVGISNGGFFSQCLALRLKGCLAAVASVAATLPQQIFDENGECDFPTPVMLILGTEDPVVPFAGGGVGMGKRKRGHAVSAAEAIAFWCRLNRSEPVPEVTDLPPIVAADRTRVRRSVYNATGHGAPVVLYEVIGGGHTWPCGWQFYREQYIGVTSQQIHASRIIWDFFKQHGRRQ